MKRFSSVLIVVLLVSCVLGQTKPIAEKTAGMEKYPGFIPFYWDEKGGKIWLEVDKLDTEFLYYSSLPAGLGSNDVGLDRNSLGRSRILKFVRIGPKVLLMQPNYEFRALSDNPVERKDVEDAFARSVIWGFKVEAEEMGKVLVDATDFLLQDVQNVVGTLKRSDQGDYRVDLSRSAFYLPNTKNFPKNTEIETILTFTSNNPGGFVRQVTPDPSSVTLREHHSFVELPDDGYEPRTYDPRSMFGSADYMDFAAPIDQPLQKRFITRHRLKKIDPNAEMSDPVKPIVYYVDRGTPELIRSALIEGAAWWNEAFEAIGYRNAFQVRLLPEDADPMDIRYNVINWIHRATRGWSSGGSVTDPRTGEILKAKITLGSQRIRQDYMIALGLVGAYEGKAGETDPMVEMALARIRQLSCHEVGHTLGVGHNYASSVNDRASVMDYPHPRIKINDDGKLDLSDAYDTGVGEWDKVYIAYGYQDFPDGVDEEKELKAILDKAFSRGLLYLTNQDASPAGGAHPLSNDWDNGTDPVDELEHKMRVRQIALNNFSESKVRVGDPLCTLEEVLVPVYLFHRYQIDAAASVLGGLYYNHTVRGGAQKPPALVPASEQRRALRALLMTIDPKNLVIPEKLLAILPPRAPGYGHHRECFPGNTGIVFDPLGAAETVANMTVECLLYPERAARLIEYHARDASLPGFSEVIDELVSFTWKTSPKQGIESEIQRIVNYVVLTELMEVADYERTSPQVRAVAWLKIDELKDWLKKRVKSEKDESQKAQLLYAASEIERFQSDPSGFQIVEPLAPPPGAPIGG
ncbi:MAG: zinc-dependent metalloprotease [bacterium]